MSLWYCTECFTAYSVGAPRCPHCTSTNYSEDVVPKSNKSGVSYGGHVDIKPEDKTQPEWVREEDAPKPEPKPKPEAPKNEIKVNAGLAQGSGKVSGPKK